MTSLFDGSVFFSVGLYLLICTASLQHLISLREPVHAYARPVEKSRRNSCVHEPETGFRQKPSGA
jgi:hypothetical protein